MRTLTPQVLGVLTRRFGDFSASEDAVQEALVAAAETWPMTGVPDNPRGWLLLVASRRMKDHIRSELARRRRETNAVLSKPSDQHMSPAVDGDLPAEEDDTLELLFMCCHPALTRPTAIALTLRAVGGLSTAEIAHAFLVPEATMAQRISRAKQKIKSSGIPFRMPTPREYKERLSAVLHVLYLVFNEGYLSSAGRGQKSADLAAEAIRLTRAVHRLLPNEAEVTGLLALMLLTEARRPARMGPDGALIPLAEQDRTLWNRDAMTEGTALVAQALAAGEVGPYQVQAAIAALHDEAARPQETDWPQILALYSLLRRMSDNPVVDLNHAVATAMVHGPRAGLDLLDALDADPRIAGHYRLDVVRAHLFEMEGENETAVKHYRAAADGTRSAQERVYLATKAARLKST